MSAGTWNGPPQGLPPLPEGWTYTEAEAVFEGWKHAPNPVLLADNARPLLNWLRARMQVHYGESALERELRETRAMLASAENDAHDAQRALAKAAELNASVELLRRGVDIEHLAPAVQRQVIDGWAREFITQRNRRSVRAELAAEGREPIKLVSAAELRDRPPIDWLVRRKIPRVGTGALLGPTGTFKSFVAKHLNVCVITGRPFLGLEVMHTGRDVYLLGEGQEGAPKRIRAAVDDLPDAGAVWDQLDYAEVPFNLGDPERADELIAAIRAKASGDPVAIVTLDAGSDFYPPGANESVASDMEPLIQQSKRVSRELVTFVLIVAHTGYEGIHQRGTSRWGQYRDFEAVAEVAGELRPLKPGETQAAWLRVTKVKEGAANHSIPFHVECVPVDGYGDGAEDTLVVRAGHPGGNGGQAAGTAPPEPWWDEWLERANPTKLRLWDEIAAYIRRHGSRDRPLSFNRVSNGVKGNQADKRQVLDRLVQSAFVGTAPGRGGHDAYFSRPGGLPELLGWTQDAGKTARKP